METKYRRTLYERIRPFILMYLLDDAMYEIECEKKIKELLPQLRWSFCVDSDRELMDYMSQRDYNLVFSSLDSYLHNVPVVNTKGSQGERTEKHQVESSRSFLDELEKEISDCMLLGAYGKQLQNTIGDIFRTGLKVVGGGIERIVPQNTLGLGDIPYLLSVLYNLLPNFRGQCEKLKTQISEHFNCISLACASGSITLSDATWVQHLCKQCCAVSCDIEMHSNNSTLLRFILKGV